MFNGLWFEDTLLDQLDDTSLLAQENDFSENMQEFKRAVENCFQEMNKSPEICSYNWLEMGYNESLNSCISRFIAREYKEMTDLFGSHFARKIPLLIFYDEAGIFASSTAGSGDFSANVMDKMRKEWTFMDHFCVFYPFYHFELHSEQVAAVRMYEARGRHHLP